MNGSRHFASPDRNAAVLAGILAFAVYFFTLAPTVTLEYSGALVVAADHLGVARPPGFPIWTLLAKGFICLFPLAEYHGHPNPAWAVNLMSAVCAALACGLLAGLTCRIAREIYPDRLGGMVAGLLAGLLFAFSPVLWSQAVVAETHALTNFYFLFLLALSLRWISAADGRPPFALAFFAGLGLSVSPLLVLFLPVLLFAAALASLRDFARLAAATLLFCGFLVAEFTWGHLRPAYAAAGLGLAAALAGALAAHRASRPVAGLFLFLLAGLVPYVYLPLASDLNPPMNMGYARTWEGFWHVVSRGQYEALVPLDPFAQFGLFRRDLAWFVRLAAEQFTAPLAALALVPALGLPWLDRRARPALLLVLVALACFAVLLIVGANPQVDVQNTWVARVQFLPAFALVALLIGAGWAILWHGIAAGARAAAPKSKET